MSSALDTLTRTTALALAPEVAADRPNPANAEDAPARERAHRVPMSAPVRRLEVDPIDGMHLHWFNENKVRRAERAGYRKIKASEVTIQGIGIGDDQDGNTDLGTDVTIVGDATENGTVRQVLMGIPEEFWLEDKAQLDKRNARIIGDIFEGESIGADSDGKVRGRPDHSYVGQAQIEAGGGQVTRVQEPVLNRGLPKHRTVRGGRAKLGNR